MMRAADCIFIEKDAGIFFELIASPGDPVHFPLGIPLGGGLPLIIQFLTSGHCQLHLYPWTGEVQGEGNKGVPILLNLGLEFENLPLVQQQLTGAPGVLVEDVALLIGGDMHSVEKHLAILDDTKGVLQVYIPLAHGLDLSSRQFDASFIFILDKVVMEGLSV